MIFFFKKDTQAWKTNTHMQTHKEAYACYCRIEEPKPQISNVELLINAQNIAKVIHVSNCVYIQNLCCCS